MRKQILVVAVLAGLAPYAHAQPPAKIEFTRALPHFKPGTDELVAPK